MSGDFDCDSLSRARWCVVHTQPHRELRANLHLKNQGYRVFLPLHRNTVRHARQFRVALAPLFPRYLFVEILVGRDRWTPIRGTQGVSHLIMDGDRPRPVPAGVVESLLAIADEMGIVHLETAMRSGQAVRITNGAFAGLVGRLATVDGNGRVKVLLDVLGKEITASGTNLGLVHAA
jgi:transcriptional antiterminator RfaH